MSAFRACIASPHYLASDVGLDVLRSGGNAVDAAVAVNLTLGVVAPYLCGFGGDLFAMVWRDGLHAYAGAGAAPAAATLDALRARTGDAMLARGPLTVTVPGAVDGWFALLERFGTRSFGSLAERALGYARDGFTPSERGDASFAGARALYAGEEEWQRVYGTATAGKLLRQADLARTIAALSEHGPDAFYRGAIADGIVGHLQERGALMEPSDMASHRGEWVDPMSISYRDVEVFEMPPPTQGVAALEAMKIAEGLPPGETAERHHVMIESIKLALADLGARVTDPRSMSASAEELLAREHIDARRRAIDPARAGDPQRWRARGGGTAYMCVADADGMLASLIQSNFAGFGSGVTVPGWGINLQNRGAWFSLDPEHVNVIAPGKRTMHTLIPAMAFRDGAPWLVFGTMGGDGQAQTHLQLIARMVDDGADPKAAIDAPRWVVSPVDWSVHAEPRFDDAVIEGLRARGHTVTTGRAFDQAMGHAHAIMVTRDGYEAASDPRTEGAALGL